MTYYLAKNRTIDEHKQVCNAIYLDAVNTPLDSEYKFTKETLKKADKTGLQLRGIHRICKLYALRLSDNGERFVDMESAKVKLKYETDFTRPANYGEALEEAVKIRKIKEIEKGVVMTDKWFENLIDNLQRYYKVPRSFASATKEDMMKILEFVKDEFVDSRGWLEMVLLPKEYRDLMERYSEK